MPEPTHVLLALMAVYLLLRRQQLPPQLLIVHAQPTPTQPMESVPLVDAPLVELVLPLLRDPLPSLNVHALQTPTVALRHASLVLLALDLVQVPPTQPLPLLFVFARLTTTENPLTVAYFVPVVAPGMPSPQLLAAPAKSPLKTASVLKAAGELIPLLLPHAQLALLAGLPSLLVVRLLLNAIDARPTISEMRSLPPH